MAYFFNVNIVSPHEVLTQGGGCLILNSRIFGSNAFLNHCVLVKTLLHPHPTNTPVFVNIFSIIVHPPYEAFLDF